MKGSLRERHAGIWELIVQLPRDPETGLGKQLSRTHYGTKREAQRALAALVAQVSEGKITSPTTDRRDSDLRSVVGFVLLDPDFSAERACRDRLMEYTNDNINGFTRRCLEINDL